jgi:hypothetical protein
MLILVTNPSLLVERVNYNGVDYWTCLENNSNRNLGGGGGTTGVPARAFLWRAAQRLRRRGNFFLARFELDCVEVREIFLAESRRSCTGLLWTKQ